MIDKVKIEWAVDQNDVLLQIEIRMDGHWFLDRARQIYHALSPQRRPADHLLEDIPEVKKWHGLNAVSRRMGYKCAQYAYSR